MTPEMYAKLSANKGKITPEQAAKLAAFEKSKEDAVKHKAKAEAEAAEAMGKVKPVAMTKADRDRMALKLSKGGYPVEKVATVEAMIADFDSKNK